MIKHPHPSGRPIRQPIRPKRRTIDTDAPMRPDVIYATPRLRPEFDKSRRGPVTDAIGYREIEPLDDGSEPWAGIGFVRFGGDKG